MATERLATGFQVQKKLQIRRGGANLASLQNLVEVLALVIDVLESKAACSDAATKKHPTMPMRNRLACRSLMSELHLVWLCDLFEENLAATAAATPKATWSAR
jgi:hypothetical protein